MRGASNHHESKARRLVRQRNLFRGECGPDLAAAWNESFQVGAQNTGTPCRHPVHWRDVVKKRSPAVIAEPAAQRLTYLITNPFPDLGVVDHIATLHGDDRQHEEFTENIPLMVHIRQPA